MPAGAVGQPAADGSARPSLTERWGSRGVAIVAALIAVVLLALGVTVGVALAPQRQAPADEPNSVDVGFAQDMIVHHGQGVLMAHLADEQTTDPEIKIISYDIAYTQTSQLGQMQGWLALWGKPEINNGTVMGWMAGSGHDHGSTGAASTPAGGALMPGMATDAEIAKLKTLRGKDSDVFFLQLMIRHHQGGAAMMDYAGRNAGNPVTRNFAGKMLDTQTSEISVMTGMLKDRGAAPLPFTAPR